MRLTIPIPRPASRAKMLPALEALVQLNEELDDELEQRGEPVVDLYEWAARTGGGYRAEPPGREDWDPAAVFMPRLWGDCEDLAGKRAADLRRAGETSARADTYRSRVRPDGTAVWHAIVVRGDGTLEDPSALLGMPTHRGHAPTGTPWADVMRAAMGQDAPSRLVLNVEELSAAYERLAPMAHRRLEVLELLDFDRDWRAVLSCAERPEACSRATRARLSDHLERWVVRLSGMPPATRSTRSSSSMGHAPLVDCVRRGDEFARTMGWHVGQLDPWDLRGASTGMLRGSTIDRALGTGGLLRAPGIRESPSSWRPGTFATRTAALGAFARANGATAGDRGWSFVSLDLSGDLFQVGASLFEAMRRRVAEVDAAATAA